MRPTFHELVHERLSRRGFLRGATAASLLWAAKGVSADATPIEPASFTPLPLSKADKLEVPAGYTWNTVVAWGDPLLPGAPAFDPAHQTPEAQAGQMGFNCDFVGFIPLPHGVRRPKRGLLCVSSEYTNPVRMWPAAELDGAKGLTRAQCDVDINAVGLNVMEVRHNADGTWRYVANSSYNRRVTPRTPIDISGPAAGDKRMRTKADRTGRRVHGTFANCSGNISPWGTWLQAEENVGDFFAADPTTLDAKAAADVASFDVPKRGWHRWENHYPRFLLNNDPNEFNRFGWIVETDPFDPNSTPIKRTALGRFEHEAATISMTPDRQVVAYMGDDKRFECIYKFVAKHRYVPGEREHNRRLLDEGVLYVAKFTNDGRGTWIPLVHGEGPLTAKNGFTSQADVLIRTRFAAQAVEATPMDRPEDIAVHPHNGHVYVALTNNTKRKTADPKSPNPRAKNKHGQILQIRERGADPCGVSFEWDIFLLGSARSSGREILSCPDNLAFDRDGNLWVATDGQPKTLKANDGVYRVATHGELRGIPQRFLSAVPGAEVCSPEFTPDERTMFCSVQHPATGSSYEDPSTRFPDYDPAIPPRPAVIAVYRKDGGRIG